MNTIEKDQTYLAKTYGRFPLEIVRGKGSIAYGVDGKEYIDMGAGIAVNIFGYADEEYNKAVVGQLETYQHTSNLYYNAPCANLGEALVKKSGLKRVFFGNSGAEANECAIKVARKWGLKNKGEGAYKIITLVGSFHGRTITTLSATGQEVFHKDFDPFTEGFVYAPFGDAKALESLVDDKTCAIMIEFIQGEGGVNVLPDSFVEKIFELQKKKNVLVIVDEVQTGNGRTGSYFAYQQYEGNPDIVTTAKGLGGGLPIGACLLGERVEDVLGKGDHGSTFGGNPVVAAGALSIVNRVDNQMLQEVKDKGEYIKNKLMGKPGILSVSGKGLMLGVELSCDAKSVIAKCLEKGVMFLSAKEKVRMLPALNIPYSLIDRALDTLLEAVKEEL